MPPPQPHHHAQAQPQAQAQAPTQAQFQPQPNAQFPPQQPQQHAQYHAQTHAEPQPQAGLGVSSRTRNRNKEPITLPAYIPLAFLALTLLCVALFTLDPLETVRALLTFREWDTKAQRALFFATLLPSLALFFLGIKRVQQVRPGGGQWSPPPTRKLGERVSLAVFLGSGGHTAEMRALLEGVDRKRYSPRVYVYCKGDEISLRAVAEVEGSNHVDEKAGQAGAKGAGAGGYSLVCLPRARSVGEGRLSTLLSASMTFAHALVHTFLLPLANAPFKPWVDVLLVNGPGTAVVLVGVAYIRRVLGLSHTRIIYVESFARVKSLSLSGKILRYFVDTFVVQWPNTSGDELTAINENAPEVPNSVSQEPNPEEVQRALEERNTRTVYRGWLV